MVVLRILFSTSWIEVVIGKVKCIVLRRSIYEMDTLMSVMVVSAPN